MAAPQRSRSASSDGPAQREDSERRGEGQRDLVVQIQGAWVRPGDWLYADADGVIVSDRALG